MYDIVFDQAPGFETTIPIFVSVIMRYAYYLHRDLPSVVIGFFSEDSDE